MCPFLKQVLAPSLPVFKISSKTDGEGMAGKYQIVTKFEKRKQPRRKQEVMCLLNGGTY